MASIAVASLDWHVDPTHGTLLADPCQARNPKAVLLMASGLNVSGVQQRGARPPGPAAENACVAADSQRTSVAGGATWLAKCSI